MLLSRLVLPLLATASQTAADLIKWDDWEHGRVALEDVSIHFRYAGSGPPLLLVHGTPQFSLAWQHIGPILAQNYTVIAPDNRGTGDSSIPPDGNYSSAVSAADLKGVLDFLNITSTYVFAHDKGVGMAVALAAQYPGLVKRLGLAEYVLPGFGYEAVAAPAPYWDLYQNPQNALFSIPDFAEFLIAGRERRFVLWYFYHGSYSGPASFSEDTISRYADSIQKPGFLRAMFGTFAAASILADAEFFNRTVGQNPLSMPVFVTGGEASIGVEPLLRQSFGPITTDLEFDVVPKAGHWITDENPAWTAKRIQQFLTKDPSPIESVDLSGLKDKVTLKVGFYGTWRNAALGGQPEGF
ncbi:putative hydrolase [Daldinia caldariorum]|uniref:putative hydrolase n=1 Tax=Daldinia caldariorum TaxID=326644 RepID=UPI00200731A1|nr:putative hydrolase [Daldinia caldariorum]KAI1464405.1 putative hydrolase [Daldinia caldariorum]